MKKRYKVRPGSIADFTVKISKGCCMLAVSAVFPAIIMLCLVSY